MCAQNCVQEVRLGELHLVFGKVDQLPFHPAAVKTKPRDKQAKQITEESEKAQLREIAEENLEQLKLSDPFGYERIMAGELVDGGTS